MAESCRVCTDFRSTMNKAFSTGPSLSKASTSPTPDKTPLSANTPDPAPVKTTPTATTASSESSAQRMPCPPDGLELGSCTWTFLHTMASYYPDQPSSYQQDQARQLMQSVSELYPCHDCADHLKSELKTNPVRAGSRYELEQWLCGVHNEAILVNGMNEARQRQRQKALSFLSSIQLSSEDVTAIGNETRTTEKSPVSPEVAPPSADALLSKTNDITVPTPSNTSMLAATATIVNPESDQRQKAMRFLVSLSDVPVDEPEKSETGQASNEQETLAKPQSAMDSGPSPLPLTPPKSPPTMTTMLPAMPVGLDAWDSMGSLGSNRRSIVDPTSNRLALLANHDRFTFVTPTMGHPMMMYSIKRFQPNEERKKHASAAVFESMSHMEGLKRRKVAESYQAALEPAPLGAYNAAALDDPELRTGKHRTVISLPCYMGSLIQYTRPSDLKRELNDQFRQKHPDLDPSLTLSKIRNLKAKLLDIAKAEDLELTTVACSYVNFEKLIQQKYVRKSNRHLIAAICLLLATKIMDRKEVRYVSLLQTMEKTLGVSTKEIREYEFPVFAKLDFNLFISAEEFMPHLDRILNSLDFKDFQEYLTYTAVHGLVQS